MYKFLIAFFAILLISIGMASAAVNVDDDADRDPMEDVSCEESDSGEVCTCSGFDQCEALYDSGRCDREIPLRDGSSYTDNDYDCPGEFQDQGELVCQCTVSFGPGGVSTRPDGYSSGTENAPTPDTRPIPPPSPMRTTPDFSAPTGLRITQEVGDRLRFTWRDNSNNEDGFVVERLVPMANRWIVFAEVSGPGGDMGSSSHSMRIEGARFPFCYRVRATRGNRRTEPTERACAGLD